MDTETATLTQEQRDLLDLVSHAGWPIAKRKILDKIALLQDAFQVDDSTPEKMLIDLQSRKAASQLLKEFIQDVEGTAQQAIEIPKTIKTHIINIED